MVLEVVLLLSHQRINPRMLLQDILVLVVKIPFLKKVNSGTNLDSVLRGEKRISECTV
jgi:hypothetical protein